MNRTHEAGALHATAGSRPDWPAAPEDVNALLPGLWPSTAAKSRDGVLEVGGRDVIGLAREFGTPLYVLDVEDLRERSRAFADAFARFDVFYASKAFCATAVVSWVAAEGLAVDVCSGGELAVALRAGVDPARLGLHGNNKTVDELTEAIRIGVGRVVVDSFDEIDRLRVLTDGLTGPDRLRVMVRCIAGVEAHTHEYIATAHEDQKFGLSIVDGDAGRAVALLEAMPGVELIGLHSHIGSQIFDTSGFEVAARRVLRLHAESCAAIGRDLPELDLGGGFGIAYNAQDTPSTPAELATSLDAIVDAECAALGIERPRLSIEPGRAIVGPSTFSLYEVGTVKRVALDGGAHRLYVAVDGGMSDNVRTALYNAEYSATLASRASTAAPELSRVVGKHCESGDILVTHEFLPSDIAPGDLLAIPGTGAYCRALASNYNHAARPAVVAVQNGEARVIVRRETLEDLLALDVGW
jgi:diaminopimelate decarboxylase